jgi:mannose-6-phosphate isomerase
LYRFTLTGEQTELPASGPRIALCTDGDALFDDADGTELKLQQSESCFLSDADGAVTATSGGHKELRANGQPDHGMRPR